MQGKFAYASYASKAVVRKSELLSASKQQHWFARRDVAVTSRLGGAEAPLRSVSLSCGRSLVYCAVPVPKSPHSMYLWEVGDFSPKKPEFCV